MNGLRRNRDAMKTFAGIIICSGFSIGKIKKPPVLDVTPEQDGLVISQELYFI